MTDSRAHRWHRRVSLASAPMTLKAASVGTLCTRAEYDALLIMFEEDLPFESRGRVRNMTLLAVNHALTAARALGRGPRTIAFVQALGTLPELWVAQAEQEANRARLEEDLLLNDRIEELELEEESCHIATELVQYVPLAGDAEDDEKATSWTLPSVPAALKAELDAYSLHRTEPLNRQRDGSAVVDITVGSDRATTLRFLGWLAAERQITPGLGVFCRAALSQWAEDYAKALADKGLKYSSVRAPFRSPVSPCLTPPLAWCADRQLPERPGDGLPVRVPDVRGRRRRAGHADDAARRAAPPPRAVRVASQAAAAVLAA